MALKTPHTFYLHLKEREWHFNNRDGDLYLELLKQVRVDAF